MHSIRYERQDLPLLHRAEVAVIGGSFAGVSAALGLARAGRTVALVEPRTYLGREVTATLRPWVRVPAAGGVAALPETLRACVEPGRAGAGDGECPLHLDAVKIRLEDMLLGAGVVLLYASLPVALLTAEGGVQGIVIGNKSGRQVILCRALVDATETALLARLAGAGFAPEPSPTARYARTLEFDGVGTPGGGTVAVPPSLGLAGDRVILHAGWRGRGHVLVECELDLPACAHDPLELTRMEAMARRATMGVAVYLVNEVPAFAQAYLGAGSHELHGPHAPRLAGDPPAWAAPFAGSAVAALAGPTRGLWCLNEAARLDPASRSALREPVPAARWGEELAGAMLRRWEDATAPTAEVPARQAPPAHSPLEVREPDGPQRGRRYAHWPVHAHDIPVLTSTSVLVVGGGTSGAVAAIVAARRGLRTALVDMNPGLGGTGTYGGIHTYWFGRRVGFAAEVMGWVNAMHDRLRLPRLRGALPQWNIEAKAQALLQQAEDAGVELLFDSLVVGTVVRGNAVCGVVVASRLGPVALLGEVVIDATGDGDVAAYAGADCVYGADRDHAVMYALMPPVEAPGRPRNVKTSMVDTANVEDYTRMILAERRRRHEEDLDHGVYLAPRESRHVRGEVGLTLTDQLLQRCWPDTVSVAFSNNDIKGQTSSDWLLMGLIPPNLEVEIPYRALLPRGLEGVLVAGKAFSASHDALPAIRMQADLENLGGAAGLAAAMAVRSGRPLRGIDVRALQEELVEVGVLPAEVLRRRLAPKKYGEGELEALVASLDAERPLHAYSDMEINQVFRGRLPLVDLLCAGPQVVPLLERALGCAQGRRRLLLAQALALVGSRAGVPALVAALQDALCGDALPSREAHVRHAGEPPDQCAMPAAAYLLHSLGMACDGRAIPVWERVADLVCCTGPEAMFDRERSVYYYVSGVCLGAERLGDGAAIPVLKRLHRHPALHGQVRTAGHDAGYLAERRGYLELLVGRALARCGSPEGVVILIDYLGDGRALLAEHAHSELVAIAGLDLGKDMAAWGQWLEATADALLPRPYRAPAEAVLAWDEDILLPVPPACGAYIDCTGDS